VVQVEGGEFAVMGPLEAGAGWQGHPGVAGGTEGGSTFGPRAHGEQVHGEAEMC
jgi:hypothetical protein